MTENPSVVTITSCTRNQKQIKKPSCR